ncbi:hypothetical protein LBMAG55_03100 [Verrucomicrobiota bacterium]|nr:hypothetical protein LBMAG55_03100 [Verrucomicrobiota bacterium]
MGLGATGITGVTGATGAAGGELGARVGAGWARTAVRAVCQQISPPAKRPANFRKAGLVGVRTGFG